MKDTNMRSFEWFMTGFLTAIAVAMLISIYIPSEDDS